MREKANTHGKRRLGILLASGLAVGGLLCASSIMADEKMTPGIDQLVVIKPGTHERGLPAVRLEPTEGGDLLVDIPPTIHVHRFYYDGDREYQGPVVMGGPTTVVANHPKTGERMYVDVTLPQGTPIIAYCGKAITYVYPDRRVKICFGGRNTDKVKVDYVSGRGLGRRTREAMSHLASHTRESMSRSAALQSIADATCDTRDALAGMKSAVDTGVSKVVDGTSNFFKGLPLISSLPSLGDDRPQRQYEAKLRGLSRSKDASSLDFIRTNR